MLGRGFNDVEVDDGRVEFDADEEDGAPKSGPQWNRQFLEEDLTFGWPSDALTVSSSQEKSAIDDKKKEDVAEVLRQIDEEYAALRRKLVALLESQQQQQGQTGEGFSDKNDPRDADFVDESSRLQLTSAASDQKYWPPQTYPRGDRIKEGEV